MPTDSTPRATPSATDPATDAATPMIAQYLEIKAGMPDALLFYRMGDFYEMFFADAEAAAAALGIALTRRGRHAGADIPMCGVPVAAAEGYLLTLIRKGFRVAVCEQIEDPAEARRRGSKAVVARAVTRLVTPGTLTEDTLLEPGRASYLAAFAEIRGDGALAWLDLSTGEFAVSPCGRAGLGPLLARLAPREVLVADGVWDAGLADLVAEGGGVLTPRGGASFDSTAAAHRLAAQFRVQTVEGFGAFARVELSALGAIVDYVALTQVGRPALIRPPLREAPSSTMQIDAATRRNLELTRSLSGGRAGSLLAAIDRTVTGAGARLMEARLTSPATDPAAIAARQDAVAPFVEDRVRAETVRRMLARVPDVARALARLTLDRGGPRDLGAVRDALGQAGAIAAALGDAGPAVWRDACARLTGHEPLVAALDAALVAEPPHLARDGGFIAPGHHAELDQVRSLRDEGRGVIAALQARYAAETGIASLKIRHNAVLGYFVETTAAHGARMRAEPLAGRFRHRQTNANVLRYGTEELTALETRILNAGARALDIELALFAGLRALVLSETAAVTGAAGALAEIDLSTAWAEIAVEQDWSRPAVEPGRAFAIAGGRHPVVEAALRRAGATGFVANDCDLSGDMSGAPPGTISTGGAPVWLLTGPNMAGKSTFLRQNALIAILAQAGAWVPARSARIGVVTQLFSRVGAADDLARGRSTFMVEMVETAAILNQAGDGALVILDEIGRGTATYDGLSIAWATLEHLHDVNRCRALFATHYHELTGLAGRLPGLRNATMAVREWEGEVIFLHEVRPGAADRSYGVQVARLAGLPAAVVDRARAVLEALERGEREGGARASALLDDLPLFAPRPAPPAPRPPPAALARLDAVDPDAMTPREALETLYALKALRAAEG